MKKPKDKFATRNYNKICVHLHFCMSIYMSCFVRTIDWIYIVDLYFVSFGLG